MNDITTDNIAKLIQEGESETIEFKASFNDEAIETIGAFSNAQGGVILIGVNNEGRVQGFQIGKKTVEDVANKIQAAADPRIQPSMTVVTIDEKEILVINVKKCSSVPVSVRGRFFKRTGKTNQRMSHEEIMQRMTDSTGLSWDAQIEYNATLNDLDQKCIDQFIKIANEIGRRPVPPGTSSEEFLRKLELIKDGIPTRAALLMFGKNPESFYQSAFLKIGRFRSSTLIVDDLEAHGPLIEQLEVAMKWFRSSLTTAFTIVGKPQRQVDWEYPLNSIREAVCNLLSHRDYRSGAHSQIRLYDDRLEFWNAGALPSTLTPEALYLEHDSIPRNRKVAEVFFYMGLVERWGSGTRSITKELVDSGFPRPEFVSLPERFRLIFHKQEQLTNEQYEDIKKIVSDRQLLAVDYIKEHGSISNSEYQEVTGLSKRSASRELKELVEKDVFAIEGTTGKGTTYRLQISKGPKGP